MTFSVSRGSHRRAVCHGATLPLYLFLATLLLDNVGYAQANSWTNTNFGKWETNSNWSLGVAPTNTQAVFITNALSKTVTIDTVTAGTTTMTVSNLTVSAPVGSANTLFLNDSGLSTPLRILNTFTLSANATLLLFGNAVVDVVGGGSGGTMTVNSGGFVNLQPGGALNVTNGILHIAGGSIQVVNATLRTRNLLIADAGAQGTLTLQAGSLAEMLADWLVASGTGTTGAVWMTGGQIVATNGFSTIASTGSGQMAVSNGTMLGAAVFVGTAAGARGTLTVAGGTIETGRGLNPTSALTVGDNASSTGTVWITSGKLIATNYNALTVSSVVVGKSGIGRLTLSNGTVNAGTVTLAQLSGSAGTLTIVGGTFTADRLVVTNINSPVSFFGGTMFLRGADFANNLGFSMAANRTATLNLPAGTNRFDLSFLIGQSGTATGLVWITGATFLTTNGITTIGDTSFGQVTLSNGSWRARDIYIGRNSFSRGVLAVAGGTNVITSELRIGSAVGCTGVVALTGGQLFVTNSFISVGYLGDGEMTVFTNGAFQSAGLIIGFNAGSRGTFTLAGATLDLRTGFSVGELARATGAVWLTTGSLIVTNPALESVVGTDGTGQMAVSNALFRTVDFRVGRNAGSRGTLTMAGGTNLFDSFFSIAPLANATGTVWITGGRVVVTNNIISLGAGIAQLTISNGVVLAKEINIVPGASGRGTLTIDGGTVTVAGLIVSNATSTVLFDAGRLIVTNSTSIANGQAFFVGAAPFTGPEGPGTAILNLSGVNHEFTGGMVVGLNATGEVWVTGTQLTVTNFLTVAGGGRTGSLTLSNATAIIGGMAVASSGPTVGTLTSANSTIKLSSFLELGSYDDFGGDRGTIWINGGQLVVTNDVTRVGRRGNGTMIVSNGTVLLKELQIATNTTASGTFTAAGGTNVVSGPVELGFEPGATGTVWLTGGQLTTTNSTNFVAYSGVGRMTVSNGTWRARNVIVGLGPNPKGELNWAGGTNVVFSTVTLGPFGFGTNSVLVSGGISSVYSNVTVGRFVCAGSNRIFVTGGELRVTNSAGNAVLEVRGGTLTQSGGTLQINRLVLTNSCARFIHTGGTLLTNVVLLDTGIGADTDGDGMANQWEQDHGFDPFNPADAALDSDGDGQSNLEEFSMGTDPNNPNSFLRIVSIVRTNNDLRITWTVAPTNGLGQFLAYNVQFGTNLTTGITSNLLPQVLVGPGFTGTTTNFLDIGGATNIPQRFYRIQGLVD